MLRFLAERSTTLEGAKRLKLEKRAARFVILNGELYKKTHQGPLLKCLDKEESEYVMNEIHEGSCVNHAGGKLLANKIVRRGYFWPTLMEDTKSFARKCEKCQNYSNRIHTPVAQLEVIKAANPFDKWGTDVVGSFPQGKGQKNFMIVVVEYFSKWIEAGYSANH
ncbi:UNVERIFIED_CONTAM: hypothetical protein Slati_1384600 [Sesamum latifolium]|uniref:Integrase zinc-binding domain-containing protein n=1 Tax=Sesamum latifolium TaxID=2727402 RepID=A0AAW2X2G1_9LAMI